MSSCCNNFSQLTGERFHFLRARTYIQQLVDTIVCARKAQISGPSQATPHGHADFLSVLLKDSAFDDPIMIRDTIVSMLFAGRDNTQNVLAWALHSLMATPQWIEHLRKEAVLNRNLNHEVAYSDVAVCYYSSFSLSMKCSYSTIQRYHFHLAVFFETVRLWPGLPKNARMALQDDVLPALPDHNIPAVKIEKGDYIFWSDYHMMRNEEVWPCLKMAGPFELTSLSCLGRYGDRQPMNLTQAATLTLMGISSSLRQLSSTALVQALGFGTSSNRLSMFLKHVLIDVVSAM